MAFSPGLLVFLAAWVVALGLFVAATARAWKKLRDAPRTTRVLVPLDWAAGAVAAVGTLAFLLGPGAPAWHVIVLVPLGVALAFPAMAFVHRFVFR